MNKLSIIQPARISKQLSDMVQVFTSNAECMFVQESTNIPDLRGHKLLFVLELNEAGFCSDILMILNELCKRGKDSLAGCSAAVLVHSNTELFTKSSASYLIFLCNSLGCAFIGHPLVEATGSLGNFITWQKTIPLALEEICLQQCKRLCDRLLQDTLPKYKKPRILALHASSRKTSNTLMLWSMIKDQLSYCEIDELNVENGTVHDCIGCSFTTCIHYSKQNSCFYGGKMVKEIIPAIERADVLVMICPNYNDAISANLTAVINRTTALYRKMSFHEKYLYSVVVSGNSGGDSVAKQLIDALNINKGFALAPWSVIFATANDPCSINEIPEINSVVNTYCTNLLNQIVQEKKEVPASN